MGHLMEFEMHRNPRDFLKPLALGAPEPLREIPVKPSRMIQFMPPQNERMRARVAETAAQVDVLLLNLEDAIPANEKLAARAERGLPPVALSRAIGDSGTVTSALIPWNSCGAYMAATLGVATFSYAPYAFFCILSPILTVVFASMGARANGQGVAQL